MSLKERRAHFNDNPVAEVRNLPPSPASSTSSLASPGPSTPPPLPVSAYSSPAQSPNHVPLSPYIPSPPQPQVYTPSPISYAHALPYIPPAPLTPGVYLHMALASPNSGFDVCARPDSHQFLHTKDLDVPASQPPRGELVLRVANLPWLVTVRPMHGHYVTVRDVLVGIYGNLRLQVRKSEYEAMDLRAQAEISQAFEVRVARNDVERSKGLRRMDFLRQRTRVQGIIRANSKEDVWIVQTH